MSQCSKDWFKSISDTDSPIQLIQSYQFCNKCSDDRNCGDSITATFMNEFRNCVTSINNGKGGRDWQLFNQSFTSNNLYEHCGIKFSSTTDLFEQLDTYKLPVYIIAVISVSSLIVVAVAVAGVIYSYRKWKKNSEVAVELGSGKDDAVPSYLVAFSRSEEDGKKDEENEDEDEEGENDSD